MTPYEAARAAFGAYAGLDAPRLPEDRWSALQVSLARWQAAHFRDRASGVITGALGIAEEMGELVEALLPLAAVVGRIPHLALKHVQGIRGLSDPEVMRARVADAVADMAIFATQLCTVLRVDFRTLYEETAREVMARDWTAKPDTAHEPPPDVLP